MKVGSFRLAVDRGTVRHSVLLSPKGKGCRTWFETIEEMQVALDEYLVVYNTRRPHQGRGMNGRTPAKAFIDGLPKETRAPTSKPQKTA